MKHKETLVFIPGFGATGEMWSYQIDHLKDLIKPKVMIMDKPSLIEMVDQVLAATDGDFSIAGSSLGGWVAQAVGARIPDRVNTLFLIDTWTTTNPEKLLYLREMQSKIEEGKQEEILAEHRSIVFYNPNLRYNACIEDLTRMHRSFPGQVLAHQLQAMIKDNDTQNLLPHIRAHTLVIHEDMTPCLILKRPNGLQTASNWGDLQWLKMPLTALRWNNHRPLQH